MLLFGAALFEIELGPLQAALCEAVLGLLQAALSSAVYGLLQAAPRDPLPSSVLCFFSLDLHCCRLDPYPCLCYCVQALVGDE